LVLRVAVGEEIVTVSLGRAADLVPGVYTVEVTLSAGTVTAARPAPGAEPTPAAEAVCAALRSLHVPGVPDGTHRADATVVPEG